MLCKHEVIGSIPIISIISPYTSSPLAKGFRKAEKHFQCVSTKWKGLCGKTFSMCFHKVEGALRKHIENVFPQSGSPFTPKS
jgi:hypothetical protein